MVRDTRDLAFVSTDWWWLSGSLPESNHIGYVSVRGGSLYAPGGVLYGAAGAFLTDRFQRLALSNEKSDILT